MNISKNVSELQVCPISTFYWFLQTVIYIPLLILYFLVLLVIILYKREFKNPYYSLVLSLGITDIVSLLYILHGFICCLVGGNYFGTSYDIGFTYLYNSCGWYSALFLNLSISINRFSAIAFFSQYKEIWTVKRIRCILLFSFVNGLLIELPVVLLAPEIYNVEEKVPTSIGRTAELTQIMDRVNLIFSIGLVAILILIYSVTVCLSVLRKKKFIGNIGKFIIDIKMLVQAMIVGILLIIAEVAYYFPIFNELSFVIFSILSTGFNPVIFLALDTKLRKMLSIFLKIHKDTTNDIIVIINSK